MSEVSYCCGCSYEDSTISDCCSVEMHHDVDICPSCREHTEPVGHICNECGNWFEEPEEEMEYEERMRENAMEERSDAKRKYNE